MSDQFITTQMTNELVNKLDQLAMREGMERGQYIRYLILKEHHTRKADQTPRWRQPVIMPKAVVR